MNRVKITMGLAIALSVAALATAHEGHAHKILGTVIAAHGAQLDVKGTDGKVSTLTLDDKTKILKGKTAIKRGDLKEGDRVVATVIQKKGSDGKANLITQEVRVGTAPPARASK